MNFTELAQNRFSVRDFSPRQIEEEKLNAVLEAGRLAPTAKNNQPQRIFVLQTPETLEKIRGITRCAFNAPTVLMIGYDTRADWVNPFHEDFRSGETDVAIVCTHMMLKATELGLGSCWVGWFDMRKTEEIFALPSHIRLCALLPLGYPSENALPSPRHADRLPLSDTVTFL